MKEKAGRIIAMIGLAFSVVLILWITLFSRLGSESRHFYPPFWSYRAILNGSGEALLEVAENVVLFIPVGVAAWLIMHLNLWKTAVLGMAFSLLIECCQWFFCSDHLKLMICCITWPGLWQALLSRDSFFLRFWDGNRIY